MSVPTSYLANDLDAMIDDFPQRAGALRLASLRVCANGGRCRREHRQF